MNRVVRKNAASKDNELGKGENRPTVIVGLEH
jgi:hypothetical protein